MGALEVKMQVNILGTPYEVIVKKYDEDEAFKERHLAGFCDPWAREIVVCDMHTYDGWNNEKENTIIECQKSTIRHEIVHAFTYESGLWDSSLGVDNSWAKNEEMVDWIAIQGAKIYKAWQEADAL